MSCASHRSDPSQDPTLDRNLNGELDSCEIAADPTLDRNLNGVLDSYEIAQNAALDRNLNGELDSCEIAADPTLDRNSNGIIDLVEIAALTAQLNCGDLDGDGEVNGADIGLMLVSYGPCAP